MLIDAIPSLGFGSVGGFEGGGAQLLIGCGTNDGVSTGAGGRNCGGRPEVDLRCNDCCCCCCCGVGTSIFRNGLSGFVIPANWFAGRP